VVRDRRGKYKTEGGEMAGSGIGRGNEWENKGQRKEDKERVERWGAGG